MDILKISDTKLKIMLDRNDMAMYDLCGADIDYNNSATRKKFWHILDDVKSRCGFETEGEKLLVQYYPSKDGGCELFVTKLCGVSQSSKRSLAKAENVTLLDGKQRIFLFRSLEDLIKASSLIRPGDNIRSSDAYLGESGEYYLTVSERGDLSRQGTGGLSLLLEFSRRVDLSRMAYISEHCRKLTSGDALARLRTATL
jgi:negative regulator of genetic competence, sporulation and motility